MPVAYRVSNQTPVQRAVGGVDEPLNFFPAQDIGQSNRPFRIGRLLNRPAALQSFDEEEAKSREVLTDGVGIEFSVGEQMRLILTDFLRP
jgi:hypothetical protein